MTSADPSAVQRRSIEAVSCDKLADAAAVALSLALGQAAETSNAENVTDTTADPVEPTHPEPSAAPPETKKAPTAPPDAAVKPWWAAGLLAMLDVGTLPKVAPGVEAFGTLGYRTIGMRVTGMILPERGSNENGPGGDFSLMAGSLSFCGFSSVDASVALCAGSEVGRLRGVGSNVTTPRAGQSLWAAPRADISWSPRVSDGFALLVQGGVAMPLIRKQFTLGNVVQVHRPESLAWRVGLGVRFDWR